jgi:BirA family biotin operon repressor/biotin-[acetyl-CoA-carboxylase] ligase
VLEPHDDRGVTARLAGTRVREVRWFGRLDSTNSYLLAAAAQGEPGGLVVVADEQTAGRGRLGRRWEARPGAGLLASVLLRPAVEPSTRPLLAGAGALAATSAVRELTGVEALVKWPNDVVVGDRKLGGLLAEVVGDAVVLGFGANVRGEGLSGDLAATATALDREAPGVPVGVADLLVAWITALDGLVTRLEAGDTAGVVRELADRMVTLGRRVRADLGRTSIEGVAEALGARGELVVRTPDGARHEVAAGDVVHLRPA